MSTEPTRRGWGAAPRNIFVYHTDKDTTEEDVMEAAKHFGAIHVKSVERRAQASSYHGSFRVMIDRNDFNKAMEASSWPCGWSVREYFMSRNTDKKNPSQSSSSGDAKEKTKSPAKTMSSPGKVKTLKDTIKDSLGGNIFNGLNKNADSDSVEALHEDIV